MKPKNMHHSLNTEPISIHSSDDEVIFIDRVKFRKNWDLTRKICEAFVTIHASRNKSASKEYAKFLCDVEDNFDSVIELVLESNDGNTTAIFDSTSETVLNTTEPIHDTNPNASDKEQFAPIINAANISSPVNDDSDEEPSVDAIEPITHTANISSPVNDSDDQQTVESIEPILYAVRNCNSANSSDEHPSVESIEPVIHAVNNDLQPSVIPVAKYTTQNVVTSPIRPEAIPDIGTTQMHNEPVPDIGTTQMHNEPVGDILQLALKDSNVIASDDIALNAEDHLINELRTSEAFTTFIISFMASRLHLGTLEKHCNLSSYSGIDIRQKELHKKYIAVSRMRNMRFFNDLFNDSANKIRTTYLSLSSEYQKAFCCNIISDITNMCKNEHIRFETIEISWLHGLFADEARQQNIDSQLTQISEEFDMCRQLYRERIQIKETEKQLDKKTVLIQQKHVSMLELQLKHKEQELRKLKLELSQQRQQRPLPMQQHQFVEQQLRQQQFQFYQQQRQQLHNPQIPSNTSNQPNPLSNLMIPMQNSPTSNPTLLSPNQPLTFFSPNDLMLRQQLQQSQRLPQPPLQRFPPPEQMQQPLSHQIETPPPNRPTISDFRHSGITYAHPDYPVVPNSMKRRNSTALSPKHYASSKKMTTTASIVQVIDTVANGPSIAPPPSYTPYARIQPDVRPLLKNPITKQQKTGRKSTCQNLMTPVSSVRFPLNPPQILQPEPSSAPQFQAGLQKLGNTIISVNKVSSVALPPQESQPGLSANPNHLKPQDLIFDNAVVKKPMLRRNTICQDRPITVEQVSSISLPPQHPQPGPILAPAFNSFSQPRGRNTVCIMMPPSHTGVLLPIRPTLEVYKDVLKLPKFLGCNDDTTEENHRNY